MKIACLFDGAGLARLGLEQAGHEVVGFELDPTKHYLGKFVGTGNCHVGDATAVDLSEFDAVWASPPCQWRSSTRAQGDPVSDFATDYLDWALSLPHKPLWVENIMSQKESDNSWGVKWNAAQFLQMPIQNRNRIIGGSYKPPKTFRIYKRAYPKVCPCITASEYKGCGSDKRRASRFYSRKLTIQECAYHQGFEIPDGWLDIPDGYTKTQWYKNIYEAIGNGVPVYMARAFGEAYV